MNSGKYDMTYKNPVLDPDFIVRWGERWGGMKILEMKTFFHLLGLMFFKDPGGGGGGRWWGFEGAKSLPRFTNEEINKHCSLTIKYKIRKL